MFNHSRVSSRVRYSCLSRPIRSEVTEIPTIILLVITAAELQSEVAIEWFSNS